MNHAEFFDAAVEGINAMKSIMEELLELALDVSENGHTDEPCTDDPCGWCDTAADMVALADRLQASAEGLEGTRFLLNELLEIEGLEVYRLEKGTLLRIHKALAAHLREIGGGQANGKVRADDGDDIPVQPPAAPWISYAVEARLKDDPTSAHVWNTRSIQLNLEAARDALKRITERRPGKRPQDFEYRIVRVTREVIE